MALLAGRNLQTGPCWFSLTPVAVPGQPNTEYEFVWQAANEPAWRQVYSVAGWFMPQDDVWVLARAFAETPALLEATIPVNIWRTGRGSKAELFVHTDWLNINLLGNKNRRWIAVSMFAQDNATDGLFKRFFLRCDVDDAVAFGNELEREIIQANREWATERNF